MFQKLCILELKFDFKKLSHNGKIYKRKVTRYTSKNPFTINLSYLKKRIRKE